MRLPCLIIVFICLAVSAQARECRFEIKSRNTSGIHSGIVLPPTFYRCLLAEIRDLKAEQARIRRIIAEFERVLGKLPVDYLNEDGKVTVEPNRPIGSANFSLASRTTGGANSLEIDQAVLEELCSRRSGCELVILFKQIGLRSPEPVNWISSGPCIFNYTVKTGEWVLSEGCGARGSLAGVDGDEAAASSGTPNDAIADAANACLLSESDVGGFDATGERALVRDHTKGMFLIAMPSRQEQGIRRFQCDLLIR